MEGSRTRKLACRHDGPRRPKARTDMAFNPFTSFRKYQKAWMAVVLLLCMVTFVLCTGVGGDLSDRILGWFRARHGSAIAKLDGRTIYSDDLQAIKTQRKVADKFIRTSMEVVLGQIDQTLKEDDKGLGKAALAQ